VEFGGDGEEAFVQAMEFAPGFVVAELQAKD